MATSQKAMATVGWRRTNATGPVGPPRTRAPFAGAPPGVVAMSAPFVAPVGAAVRSLDTDDTRRLEQAGRTHEQDDQQHEERDRRLVAGRQVRTGDRLTGSDQQPTDQAATGVAHAADCRGHEALDEHQ